MRIALALLLPLYCATLFIMFIDLTLCVPMFLTLFATESILLACTLAFGVRGMVEPALWSAVFFVATFIVFLATGLFCNTQVKAVEAEIRTVAAELNEYKVVHGHFPEDLSVLPNSNGVLKATIGVFWKRQARYIRHDGTFYFRFSISAPDDCEYSSVWEKFTYLD